MAKILDLQDLVPGAQLGHYIISERLAQGGMGTVFKALEPALERYVAIKVLRPEYATNPDHVQYFQEEARAVAALRHANIVPIYFIGMEGRVAFFSMAFIQGKTFDDWIDAKRWFTQDEAKWFLRQAISALSVASRNNIVHLDIKPANFLIDQNNVIMLTDFGLAQKIIKEATNQPEREAFGTPAYVSPEQISREKTDQRTDMYSLGATLFHLMVGRPPFEGQTVEEIVWGHLEKPFPFEVAQEAGLPPGWIYLIRKMMERSPDDRFSSYEEMKQALVDVNHFSYETAVPEAAPPPRPLSFPRTQNNPQTLHGLIKTGEGGWEVNSNKGTTTAAVMRITEEKVREAISNRETVGDHLAVDALASTIRDLCVTRADDPEDLVAAMEKVPGYDHALRGLAYFMNAEIPEGADAYEILETIGLERARNLALTFFALNYEWNDFSCFDWTPLWRHQISVGIVMDFLYDALDLRRSGLEYATGAFHDIGKLILAQLFPYAYFNALTLSLQNEKPLVVCERRTFSMDHTVIVEEWMQAQGISSVLTAAVRQHEQPEKVSHRSILCHALISGNHLVKQIGIGYSGNCFLDPRPWAELPSTQIIWQARRNKDYAYEDFTQDILSQFENFPELI